MSDEKPIDKSHTNWDCILRPEKTVDLAPVGTRLEVNSPRFCLNSALQLAQLSHVVYVPDPDQRQQLANSIGMREIMSFTKWGLHWSRFEPGDAGSDAHTVLCFRGSCDPRHWIFNVGALLVDWPHGGKVHMGFQQAYRKLKPTLEQEFADRPTNQMVIAGHSLGAALAQLAASDLGVPCRSTYTFGSPRPGNREFRDTLEAKTTIHRIVHGHDFVTQLPQHWKRLNSLAFVHPGLPVHISGDGNYDEGTEARLPSSEEMLQQSLEAIKATKAVARPVPALLDHAPIHYVRVLRKCLDQASPQP